MQDDGIVPACASFFEVANPSTEATHKEPSLTLPKAFISRFHTYLSETLVLEAPNGEIWEACLEADTEKQLRITSGWKNLAKCLNIQSGDLLVFDLVSKGHFQVYVYEGEDMCEKHLYQVKHRVESDDKSKYATSSPQLSASAKKRKREAMHECKVHTSSNVGNGNGSDWERETYLENASTPKALELKETENIETPVANIWNHIQVPLHLRPYRQSGTMKRLTKTCVTLKDLHEVIPKFHVETQNAFKAALSYTSQKPFTIVMMIHSSICRGFKVGIPRSFAKQHMGANPEHVALIDVENRAWSVTWLGYDNPEAVFSGGWKHFAKDHSLKCGDICIFEKGCTKALSTFKVHIFRVDDGDGQIIQQVIPSKLSNVIARV
ncbi:hypothetical protein GOP47_0029762 [Adiantum capillus-veneris]|nr:hypothetical protein GOP47_0029762 [Adiantum capillus-veneris]